MKEKKKTRTRNFIRYHEVSLLFIDTQRIILSGCSQLPFTEKLVFPHIKRKKIYNFVLLTCCLLQLCYPSQGQEGKHLAIWSQNPILAIVKLFFYVLERITSNTTLGPAISIANLSRLLPAGVQNFNRSKPTEGNKTPQKMYTYSSASSVC